MSAIIPLLCLLAAAALFLARAAIMARRDVRRIHLYLTEHPASNAQEIAEAQRLPERYVVARLSGMCRAHRVRERDGHFTLHPRRARRRAKS